MRWARRYSLVVAPTHTSQAWKLAKDRRYAAAAADHTPRPRHSHTGMALAAAFVPVAGSWCAVFAAESPDAAAGVPSLNAKYKHQAHATATRDAEAAAEVTKAKNTR